MMSSYFMSMFYFYSTEVHIQLDNGMCEATQVKCPVTITGAASFLAAEKATGHLPMVSQIRSK